MFCKSGQDREVNLAFFPKESKGEVRVRAEPEQALKLPWKRISASRKFSYFKGINYSVESTVTLKGKKTAKASWGFVLDASEPLLFLFLEGKLLEIKRQIKKKKKKGCLLLLSNSHLDWCPKASTERHHTPQLAWASKDKSLLKGYTCHSLCSLQKVCKGKGRVLYCAMPLKSFFHQFLLLLPVKNHF